MPITDQLLDQLLADCKSPEDLMGEQGLLRQLTKKLAERALEAEMEHHLGYAKHDPAGKKSGNSRNGKTSKTVRSVHGEIELEVPRDRNSTFEPRLVKKSEKQLGGFDERIISLYARGMSTRDIQAHFEEAYDVEVSPTFISQVTNAVLDEVKIWQQRPLNKSIWTVWWSAAATLEPFKTKRFISHLASTVTVKKSCWAFGCRKTKALNSG